MLKKSNLLQLKNSGPRRLRSQMVLAFLLVQGLVMLVFVWHHHQREDDFLEEQGENQGITLTSLLADSSGEILDREDSAGLQNIMIRYRRWPHLQYILFLRANQVVAQYTRGSGHDSPPLPALKKILPDISKPTVLDLGDDRFEAVAPVFHGQHREGWVVVGMGKGYIHENAARLFNNASYYLFFALILGGILVIIISRRLTRGIYQLTGAVESISEGNRSLRIKNVDSLEIQALVNSFNRMLDTVGRNEEILQSILKNLPAGVWLFDEKGTLLSSNLAGKNIWGLESPSSLQSFQHSGARFTESGTLVKPEDWSASVALRTQRPVQNREIQIPSNGLPERTILSSAVPLTDQEGKVTGALAIDLDVTNLRQAEAELSNYKNALNQAAILAITEPDGRILHVNENFCLISGYSLEELKGKNHRLLNSGYHDEEFFLDLWSTLQSGKIWRGSIRNQSKSGIFYWVDSTIVPFLNAQGKPTRFISISTDISIRKEAEEKVSRMNLAIQSQNLELQSLNRLSELANTPGLRLEDILSSAISFLPDAFTEVDAVGLRINLNERDYQNLHYEEAKVQLHIPIKKGHQETGFIKMSCQYPEKFVNGARQRAQKESFLQSAADIIGNCFERLCTQREVTKLNRLYRFISGVNEAMLKANTRDEVFQSACQLAVDLGGFRMSWIGLVNRENNEVDPVFWAGHNDGYLDKVSIRTDEAPEGRGPAGLSVQSRSCQFCNDITTEPSMRPWREEALKRDFHASVSLPLMIQGEVVAVYIMYMNEANFFNPEEIKLLNDVSDNINFVLEKIQLQELRKKAEKRLEQSESQFRNLVEQSLAGVFILQDYQVAYANPVAGKIFGYQSEALTSGSEIREKIIYHEDAEFIQEQFQGLLENPDSSRHFEFRGLHAKGRILHLQALLSTIRYNNRPAFIVTVIDITDQVEEEKKINLAITEAQEKERTEISMELHDNVQQILVASILSMDLAGNKMEDSAAARELLVQSKTYLRQGIDELRKLAHQLAPPVDVFTDFRETVQHMIYTTFGKTDIKIDLSIDPVTRTLPATAQVAFYRIVQEQLTNIMKHAQANHINVSVQKQPHKIHLRVEDNGVGFNPHKKKPGIGLENMRRRTQILGGEMKIISSQGKGCILDVSIPT